MERAGPSPEREWTVTLWLRDGTQAAQIIGIDRKETALLTAARALVGADVTLPRCYRALIEGWDARRRAQREWWIGEAPACPPEPPPPMPTPAPREAKRRGRWPWSR